MPPLSNAGILALETDRQTDMPRQTPHLLHLRLDEDKNPLLIVSGVRVGSLVLQGARGKKSGDWPIIWQG